MGINHVLFIVVFIFALLWFGLLVEEKWSYVMLGQPLDRSQNPGARMQSVATFVFGQKRLFKANYSGPIHFALFWGFLVLTVGSVIFLIRGLFPSVGAPAGIPADILNTATDVMAVAVLIALGMAGYKRYVMRPKRLVRNFDALAVLILIAIVVLADVAIESFGIALSPHGSFAPLGGVIAGWFRTFGPAADQHGILAADWVKLLSLMGFLVYLPYSKHFHLFVAPLNIYHRNLEPLGRLPSLDLEDENAESFGVGQVTDLALEGPATALLTGRMGGEPAFWKRYRGGTAGRLWIATGDDPLFTRLLPGLDCQLAAPMLIGGRLAFLADHEGTGNIYSIALDGSGIRRHTDHDGFYVRNPSTDGSRVVYHVAGEIWIIDSLDAQPRKLDIRLSAPPVARAPRLLTAADGLSAVGSDRSGRASVVTVRGTVHWLTHSEGPARALTAAPDARARLAAMLGETGKAVWVTDAGGEDALEVAEIDDPAGSLRRIGAGQLGFVSNLTPSPDGAPP